LKFAPAEAFSMLSFSHLENIVATRISLLRSVRRNEERQQIGTSTTPFAQGLMDIEKGCLLRLSEAARNVNQIQIALNSVIRAQRLEKSPSFAVLQEFSNVLWRQKEKQVAVQFLERLVSQDFKPPHNDTIDPTQRAVLLARLVRQPVAYTSGSINWFLGYMVIGGLLAEPYRYP